MTDERSQLQAETEMLHAKIQDLNDEHSRLLRECKDYLNAKQGNINAGGMVPSEVQAQ